MTKFVENICPYCGSEDNLESIEFEGTGGSIEGECSDGFKCCDCGRSFTVYTEVKIIEIIGDDGERMEW